MGRLIQPNQDTQMLLDRIEELETQLRALTGRPAQVMQKLSEIYVARSLVNITARSGSTAGSGGTSGAVMICGLEDNGTIFDTSRTEDCWNVSSAATVAGRYLVVGRENITGRLVELVESCT